MLRQFTITLSCLLLGIATDAQIRANYVESTAPRTTTYELESYRNSIWESLPEPDGWTNDYEGLFNNEEEQTLSSLISKLESRTGVEIAIVTVDTNMVQSDKFQEFSDHILKKWGVGKKFRDNGIVVCISSGYRKINISHGVGVEKYLSDAIVRQLIAKEFIPLYRKQNYYGGTLKGLIALINKIQVVQ
jgi:uncharacterized protein